MLFWFIPTSISWVPDWIWTGFSADLGRLISQWVGLTQDFSRQRVGAALITKESPTQELNRHIIESTGGVLITRRDKLFDDIPRILKENPWKYSASYTNTGSHLSTGWKIGLISHES